MEALSPRALAWCAMVLVASYALRGSTGFGGFAAMPLLALAVPIKVLVPVWTLLTVASSATLVIRDRQHVQLRHLLRIAPSALLGIGVGLLAFTRLPPEHLARAFGLFVLGYGLWSLRGTRPCAAAPGPGRAARALADAASFLAGALGTVFGTMASIFFAMYLDLHRLAKEHFRGTLSAMMLTLGVIRGVGYVSVGELGFDALVLFAAAFPLMLAGLAIGDRIHTGLGEVAFRRIVCAVLIASGALLTLR